MYPDPPLCKLEARQEGSASLHPNSSHRPKVMEKGDNFPSTSSTRYFSDKKTDICPRLFHEKYQFLYVFCHCAILVLKKLFQIIFLTHLCPVYFNRLDCVHKQPPSTWRSLSTAWISCKNNRCIFFYFFLANKSLKQ